MTEATESAAAGVIDCDVHCVPTIDDLYPHLDGVWVDYLRAAGDYAPGGLNATYPAWSTMLATPRGDLTLDTLGRDVLTRCSIAILQCYYGVESIQHPYLGPVIATAVNDWVRTQWLDRDDRLIASAVITPQHTVAAVAEIHRVASDKRFVQLMLPVRSWDPYGHQRYWPIWEAAAEHDLVVGLNFGGAAGSSPTPVGWPGSRFEEYVIAGQVFQTHLMSMIMHGVFDRHPNLRVVVMESGWTWLPDLLWTMDTNWKSSRRDVPWVSDWPSAYVRRHVSFTSQPIDAPPHRDQLKRVLEHLGSDDLLLFGSDYPHHYDAGSEVLLECLEPEQAERLLWSNADRVYGLADKGLVAR